MYFMMGPSPDCQWCRKVSELAPDVSPSRIRYRCKNCYSRTSTQPPLSCRRFLRDLLEQVVCEFLGAIGNLFLGY